MYEQLMGLFPKIPFISDGISKVTGLFSFGGNTKLILLLLFFPLAVVLLFIFCLCKRQQQQANMIPLPKQLR